MTPTITPTVTPTATGPDFSLINGSDWVGTGTTSLNACGFSTSAPLGGTFDVNASNGTGTWTKVHTSAGVTFTFPVTVTFNSGDRSFRMTVTRSFPIGSSIFDVTEDYALTGSTDGRYRLVTGSQKFVGNCGTVIYAVRMSR